jgi:hypothetical protein
LYFCTSKASKLSTSRLPPSPTHPPPTAQPRLPLSLLSLRRLPPPLRPRHPPPSPPRAHLLRRRRGGRSCRGCLELVCVCVRARSLSLQFARANWIFRSRDLSRSLDLSRSRDLEISPVRAHPAAQRARVARVRGCSWQPRASVCRRESGEGARRQAWRRRACAGGPVRCARAHPATGIARLLLHHLLLLLLLLLFPPPHPRRRGLRQEEEGGGQVHASRGARRARAASSARKAPR